MRSLYSVSMFKNMNGGRFDSDSDVFEIDMNNLADEKIKEQLKGQDMAEPVFEGFSPEDFENLDPEFLEGMESLVEDVSPEDKAKEILDEANSEAEDILNDANEKAQNIIDEANQKRDAIYHEAQDSGYNEGMDKANSEFANMKKELDNERAAFEQERQIKEASMEKDLVDKILDVVDRVFHTALSEDKDIILKLVTDAISGIENAKHFTIHVAPGNLDFMDSMLEVIQAKVGSSCTLEVSGDSSISDDGCLIETETGMFDVSPFKEFDNLAHRIRVLSS